MRVLIIHNEYKHQGGEESVVRMQRDLLRSSGHQVTTYIRNYYDIHSRPLGKIRTLFTSLYHRKVIRELQQIVRKEQPDVAYIHNLFPVISASILPMLHKEGVRTVMFLHNFRLLCPTGLFYTHSEICTRCAQNSSREWNCILHRCEGTYAGSIAFALRAYWSRINGYFTQNIDQFNALSDFQKSRLGPLCNDLKSSFKNRVLVIPNALDFNSMPPGETSSKQNYFAWVGRLSAEKGIDLLVKAAQTLPQYQFKIAGGDHTQLPKGIKLPNNIELVGYLNKDQLASFYSHAIATLITTRCYESFGLTAIESAFYHTPSIVPDNGTFDSLVIHEKSGLHYKMNNAESLCLSIQTIAENLPLRNKMGEEAFEHVTQEYNQKKYLERLTNPFRHTSMPTFSIITVCYNAEDLITKTIESIIHQSYPHIEYIIIDGASSDHTLEKIASHRNHISRVISEKDNGIYDAMNKGIKIATGDYLLFINAGDQLHSSTIIEEIAELIRMRPTLPDVIYGDTSLIDPQGDYLRQRRLRPPRQLTWKSFRMGMLVCHQSFIVRRTIAPLYNTNYKLSADFDWTIQCLQHPGEKVNAKRTISLFMEGGATTQRHRQSLRERYHIMCHYYGTIPTQIRHLWFAARTLFKR